jgi:hypothetical protein
MEEIQLLKRILVLVSFNQDNLLYLFQTIISSKHSLKEFHFVKKFLPLFNHWFYFISGHLHQYYQICWNYHKSFHGGLLLCSFVRCKSLRNGHFVNLSSYLCLDPIQEIFSSDLSLCYQNYGYDQQQLHQFHDQL